MRQVSSQWSTCFSHQGRHNDGKSPWYEVLSCTELRRDPSFAANRFEAVLVRRLPTITSHRKIGLLRNVVVNRPEGEVERRAEVIVRSCFWMEVHSVYPTCKSMVFRRFESGVWLEGVRGQGLMESHLLWRWYWRTLPWCRDCIFVWWSTSQKYWG